MPAKKKTEEIKVTNEEVQNDSESKKSDLPEKPKRTRKKKSDAESSEKLPVAKSKRTKAKEVTESVTEEVFETSESSAVNSSTSTTERFLSSILS